MQKLDSQYIVDNIDYNQLLEIYVLFRTKLGDQYDLAKNLNEAYVRTIINNDLMKKFNDYEYKRSRNLELPKFSNEEIKILRQLNLMEKDTEVLTIDYREIYYRYYSCQSSYLLEGNFHFVIDKIVSLYLEKI